jgi:hypothetical protein
MDFMECLYTQASLMELEMRRDQVSPHDPRLPDEVVLSSAEQRTWTRRSHKSLIVILSQEAKNRFPLIRKSEANYLVVRRYIHDRLTEHGVRPWRIRSVIEIAVELAFVPDEYQIEAATFAATAQVNLAHERLERSRTNRSGILSLFNWTTYRETQRGFAAV